MIQLESVVLVAFGSTKVQETIRALKYCQKNISFYDVIYFTDYIINDSSIKHIPIRNIPSKADYQKFIVNESADLILSSVPKSFNGHILSINWDGFIVNSNAWTNEFLNYDYIGAPWPWFNYMVGNGGFCLKSIKFLKTQQKLCNNYVIKHPEDVELCLILRKQFEDLGCKYADTNTGFAFSTEYGCYTQYNSFGFHDFKYHPQFENIIGDKK